MAWYDQLTYVQYPGIPVDICLGFPDTVDKLDPEIGQLGGPRPVVFCKTLNGSRIYRKLIKAVL